MTEHEDALDHWERAQPCLEGQRVVLQAVGEVDELVDAAKVLPVVGLGWVFLVEVASGPFGQVGVELEDGLAGLVLGALDDHHLV